MVLQLGRLRMLVCDEERTGRFARIHREDLDGHIVRALEVATILDARITAGVQALGLDPENAENEEVDHQISDLAHCRNLLEELYDGLVMTRDLADIEAVKSGPGLN